jgi:hypothetical protein
MLRRAGRGRKEGGLDRHRDLNPRTQMRIAWQRSNRCGSIPWIAKMVDPLDIARVRGGVHASRRRQASLPSLGQPAIAD